MEILDCEAQRKEKNMELLKFIMWLTVGAVIGWFANRLVEVEQRRTVKLVPLEASGT
jgi:hypothetical protein